MGRYKITFTRRELKAKLNYRLCDATLSTLQHGVIHKGKFYPPILKEGTDWYESKLKNIFFYTSSIKKLEKFLNSKEKNLIPNIK